MADLVDLHTNLGTIRIELDAEKAPKTVKNFLDYVKSGHYDGTIFHRVIDGFMIQGGGFSAGMQEKGTQAKITNEADNGLKNVRYTVAMARTSDPHSATAQFFINVTDNPFLDHRSPTAQGWGYCVFGRVIEGFETIDAIKVVATGSQNGHADVPKTDVVIEKASIATPATA